MISMLNCYDNEDIFMDILKVHAPQGKSILEQTMRLS